MLAENTVWYPNMILHRRCHAELTAFVGFSRTTWIKSEAKRLTWNWPPSKFPVFHIETVACQIRPLHIRNKHHFRISNRSTNPNPARHKVDLPFISHFIGINCMSSQNPLVLLSYLIPWPLVGAYLFLSVFTSFSVILSCLFLIFIRCTCRFHCQAGFLFSYVYILTWAKNRTFKTKRQI